MLATFAEAAQVLERDDYRQVAKRNAEFLRFDEHMISLGGDRCAAIANRDQSLVGTDLT